MCLSVERTTPLSPLHSPERRDTAMEGEDWPPQTGARSGPGPTLTDRMLPFWSMWQQVKKRLTKMRPVDQTTGLPWCLECFRPTLGSGLNLKDAGNFNNINISPLTVQLNIFQHRSSISVSVLPCMSRTVSPVFFFYCASQIHNKPGKASGLTHLFGGHWF